VVEGERDAFELSFREPSSFRRVVSPLQSSRHPRRFIKHGDVVSARIPIGVRVHSEQRSDAHFEARLFECLPGATFLRPLVPVEEAAGKTPAALERRTAAAHEEESSLFVANPGVHGDSRNLLALVEKTRIGHASPGSGGP
jgi:hypothetical protein